MFDHPVTFKEADDAIGNRMDRPTAAKYKDIMATWSAGARQRAFFSSRVMDATVLSELHRTVQKVVSGGMTERQAVRIIRERFAGPDADALSAMGFAPKQDAQGVSQLASIRRIKLVMHTNVRMAQECGHFRQWEAVRDMYPYGIWHCGYAEEHRPEHLARDGRLYPFEHPIWRHSPPGGEFNCHCWREPVTADDARGMRPEPMDSSFEPSSLGFDPSMPMDGEDVQQGKRVLPSLSQKAKAQPCPDDVLTDMDARRRAEEEARRVAEENEKHMAHRLEQLERAKEGRKERLKEARENVSSLKESIVDALYTDGKDSEKIAVLMAEYDRAHKRLSHFLGKKQLDGYAGKLLKTQISKEQKRLSEEVSKYSEELENVVSMAKADGEYSGIWKNYVANPFDYDKLKDSVKSKYDYYNIHPGNEDKVELLKEFEEKGKKWSSDISSARERLEYAKERQEHFLFLNTDYDKQAYTQARKDAAKWFREHEHQQADAYFSQYDEITHNAPENERNAAIDYTFGSGGFNRPLSGYKNSWTDPGSFLGVGNVDIDQEGKRENINLLTRFINRFSLVDDTWVQRGDEQGDRAYKNLLGLEKSLFSMSEEELQKLVGTTFTDTKFLSGAVNKGSGFRGVISNIYLPKGTHAAWLEPISHYKGANERELLIQRGMTFKITKVEYNRKKGILFFDLEAHNEIPLKLLQ